MPQTTAPAAPSSAVVGRDRALVAGVAGAIAFALVGWRALLVPSLLRSIEDAYAQDDAALGAYFLVASAAYAAGTLAGGVMLRRLEARATLGLAGLSMALGLIAQGVVGDWTVFLAAGAPSGFGAGLAEMAINALFLDLFPGSRGRSLNLLHLSFSIAALAAPVVVAQLVAGGTPWQEVMAGSGLAWLVMTAMLVAATPRVTHLPPAGLDAAPTPTGRLGRLTPALLLLALAIGCYVASEVGASDWMVRFLEDLPVTEASLALTMFWGGVAVGRLVFARVGSRTEPVRTAAAMVMAGAALQAAAVLVPDPRLAILLFGAVGVAFGPVYPLIVAAGGARMPERTALVASTLTFTAVVGAVVYSPMMGLISVTVGIWVAMLGTAVLALASGVALLAIRPLDARR